MSEYDYPFDNHDDYDEEEEMMGCDYGAEFCEDPFSKQMGLCTTECKLYFDMVREQEKHYSGRSLSSVKWWHPLALWFGLWIIYLVIISVALS
jgi:hypothetical protein